MHHKPPCALCEHEATHLTLPPPVPSAPVLLTKRRPRQVDTSRHFCPHPNCDYRGWVGLGNLRANGHPSGGPWRQLHCTGCDGYFLETHAALAALHQLCGDEVHPDRPVIASERGGSLTASSVTKGFFHLSQDLGMTGCSSHSGRRTFSTRAARKVSEVGGSVRQVRTAVTAHWTATHSSQRSAG